MLICFYSGRDEGRERMNFVDERNRFAGFVVDQQCCEQCCVRVIDLRGSKIYPDKDSDDMQCWRGLRFAAESPIEDDGRVVAELLKDDDYRCNDRGGMVRFKLVNDRNVHMGWLFFMNSHNGWYSHEGEYHMEAGKGFWL